VNRAPSGVDAILRPRSVAVIGASRRPLSIGREILHNLIAFGFQGPVFPVNRRAEAVHSLKAWPSIGAVPGEVDLAVIVVPRPEVLRVVRACARKGVKGLVVITAGFRETGPEGAEVERLLLQVVRRNGMRLVGPNCMGVLNTDPGIRLNASFASAWPLPGRIGFMSQSGALGEAILATAAELGLGLARFVSLGNKTDVSGNDLLEHWARDRDVDVILMYLESFGNARRFVDLARRVSRDKPIIAVKSGRTAAGARAAASHTGALAGQEVAVDTLLRQCGVIRVSTMAEMFTLAQGFALQPLPAGDRVAIVTNAGGPGILATDALVSAGVRLAELSAGTRRRLRRALPVEATVDNPIDMIASADAERYAAVLGPVLSDPTVDAVLVIFVTPVYIDALAVAHAIVAAAGRRTKPVLTCFMGRTHAREAVEYLKTNRIPVFSFPEEAATALTAMVRHREWRARRRGRVRSYRMDAAAARRVLVRARRAGRAWLDEPATRALLTAAGLPLVAARPVRSAAEAGREARRLGLPVALKGFSDRFTHKTEVGAVRLDLRSGADVAAAFDDMAARLRRVDPAVRFVVQQMIAGGRELILGGVTDPAFGPILMFGLGGTEVEVVRDVSYALCPVSDADAEQLIRDLRGAALLTGFRGRPAVDLRAVAAWIGRLSQLLVAHPEIAEIELNPVLAAPRGRPAGVIDARVRLSRSV